MQKRGKKVVARLNAPYDKNSDSIKTRPWSTKKIDESPARGAIWRPKNAFLTKNGTWYKRVKTSPFFGTPKNRVFSGFFDFFHNFKEKKTRRTECNIRPVTIKNKKQKIKKNYKKNL